MFSLNSFSRERHRSPAPPPIDLSVDSGREADGQSRFSSPSRIPTVPPPPYEPNTTDATTSMVDDKDLSLIVMFRQDYAQARLYVREMDFRMAMRNALRRHLYKWYALAVIIISLTVLLSAKHESIVDFLKPVTQKIRSWPMGWLVPLALLVVVSFPPLLGHELIGVLCGLVWGLGIGFGILAAGTFLGEIAVWVAFKWFCTARANKFERKNKLYASLTQLIREKSFMFVLVLRFSAVPGHITTAVSASAGASFVAYLAAAFLTLPKQLTIVYLGTAFGQKSTRNTIISVMTTGFTLVATVVAAVYIYYQMRLVMRRQALTLPTTAPCQEVAVEIAQMRLMSEDVDRRLNAALHARKPWLFSVDSYADSSSINYGQRTPQRAWSMPHHMSEDELREWHDELRSSLGSTQEASQVAGGTSVFLDEDVPQLEYVTRPNKSNRSIDRNDSHQQRHSNGSDDIFDLDEMDKKSSVLFTVKDVDASSTPSISPSISFKPLLTQSLLPHSNVGLYPPSPSLGATPLLGPIRPGFSRPGSSIGKSSKEDIYPSRAASLDGQRPSRNVMGGRDIADEADLYAMRHGARRPEYGRSRGDSRAALLGRPRAGSDISSIGDENLLSVSLSSTAGPSGLAVGGRSRSGSGVGVGGRSRSGSGVGLIGRSRSGSNTSIMELPHPVLIPIPLKGKGKERETTTELLLPESRPNVFSDLSKREENEISVVNHHIRQSIFDISVDHESLEMESGLRKGDQDGKEEFGQNGHLVDRIENDQSNERSTSVP
ncbi:hypothetical protein M231_02970 [Tremella mesenterica]|uniref:Golgi apparatus membrane protein TVP38 n=1 Tax=Tremella mesenterica TaxID=5217 RepID=A0A4V1M4B4_TREME|nr:hypothetical protein M231_02970 [Tremella mesenterica]